MMKIRIVLPKPNHGQVSPQTRKSIDCLMHSNIADFELTEVTSVYVSKARNYGIAKGCTLVKQIIFDCDYILQVDADIEFEVIAIEKLIAAKKDVISAAYQRRDYPDDMTAGFWDEKKGLSFIPWNSTGLIKVGFTGAGIQLIDTKVFNRITYPWYYFYTIEMLDFKGSLHAYEVGEDIGFAKKCMKENIEIWVDCDNKVQHLTKWNGVSMENPIKQEQGVDLKAFMMYQAGALDSIKASIDKLVNDYNRNIAQLVKENETLKQPKETLKAG
jgi:hypothetical protein